MKLTRRIDPAQALTLVRKKWDTHHASWLSSATGSSLPLSLILNSLTDRDVATERQATLEWVMAWKEATQTWEVGAFQLEWATRKWPSGEQKIPHRLLVPSADAAAVLLSEGRGWECAKRRYNQWVEQFPELTGSRTLERLCDEVLAQYDDADFERLTRLLSWLRQNPHSGLYLRQLPVANIDTKWVERRKGVVSDLARALLDRGDANTLQQACGLRCEPTRLRIRVLDPALRKMTGSLGDIQAPVMEIASLPLRPRNVLIVENINTGIALLDTPDTVVFMGLGLAVDLLDSIPWILQADRIVYWGDLDTHGFAALARARRRFPGLRSVLMDEATLLKHKELWVVEGSPSRAENLQCLTDSERAVYEALRTNIWGKQVRLEQERVAWPLAMHALSTVLAAEVCSNTSSLRN
jgi:hypothetical protein